VLYGKHLAAPSKAALNLVADQKYLLPFQFGSYAIEKGWGKRSDPSVALNGFDD